MRNMYLTKVLYQDISWFDSKESIKRFFKHNSEIETLRDRRGRRTRAYTDGIWKSCQLRED